MGALADKAINLVGESRDSYQCNQVVNKVYYNDKNAMVNGHHRLAKDYLTWGVPTSEPEEGVVIVGNDGGHVGIFVSKTEFVHSSWGRWEVMKVPISGIGDVFKHGYVYRKQQ